MTSFMFYSYQGDAVMRFNFETVIQLHFTVEHYTVVHNQAIVSNPYFRNPSWQKKQIS
jgi:hypothetical protein